MSSIASTRWGNSPLRWRSILNFQKKVVTIQRYQRRLPAFATVTQYDEELSQAIQTDFQSFCGCLKFSSAYSTIVITKVLFFLLPGRHSGMHCCYYPSRTTPSFCFEDLRQRKEWTSFTDNATFFGETSAVVSDVFSSCFWSQRWSLWFLKVFFSALPSISLFVV